MKQLKIILTGTSGFVGEGVLLACLAHPQVSEVLMVNRKHLARTHPKLKELIVPDFFQLDQYTDALSGYDTCFYCAGISSAGMKEAAYTRITYDTTMAFAEALLKINTAITFCFISGSHTDSSEQGKVMWARIKGKTENALMRLPFKQEYNFRPGGMIPTAGQQQVKPFYKWIIKLIALVAPGSFSTLEAVGLAMIRAAAAGYPKQILEVSDIKSLAKQ